MLRKGVKDTLTSVLAVAVHDKTQLQLSVALCKSILTCGKIRVLWKQCASEKWWELNVKQIALDYADVGTADGSPEETGEFDDDEEFKIGNDDAGAASNKNNSRWTSRVFAAECVRKILISSPLILNESGPGMYF